jgi:hypothetical protein
MHGHGMNPFEEFDVEYIWQPYWTFVNPQNGAIDYKYFNQYKNKLVIINFSSEHWNNFESLVCEQLSKTDINFLILTYDHTRHQEHPRMFYFPYWYHWSNLPEEGWKNWLDKKFTISKTKPYLLGCLNGKPRSHRVANFLKLRKKPYWNNSSVSFYNYPLTDRGDALELSDEELLEYSIVEQTLTPGDRPKVTIGDLHLNLPQLNEVYLHLTTETTVLPKVFISEKTWKPIATAVPFVTWGNPGTLSWLKAQGVDTYDDVIDHKYYDNEIDDRTRLDKLYEVIDDLIVHGVDQLYNQLLDRAIANQTKFFNGEFDKTYLSSIINAINQYK